MERITHTEAGRPQHTKGTIPGSVALRRLFEDELRDIYWAERRLAILLPKLADHIGSEEIADAVLDDLACVFEHISGLERVFRSVSMNPQPNRCDTMAGLAAEAERLTRKRGICTFRDSALLSVIKQIRYYEITSLGILCSFARAMGEVDALRILEGMLEEKREGFSKLIQSAKNLLNG